MPNLWKIVHCTIGPYPRRMPEGMFDPMPEVKVTYENGETETLFSFYPDEINFGPNEFLDLTRDEALRLRHRRDVAYLRS